MDQQLKQSILEHAGEHYGITSHDLKVISEGFQNKVFLYSKNDIEYIMRFTSIEKRTKEMVNEEITWVRFMKNRGVSVSGAVQSTHDRFIEEVHDYYVTVFEKASGGPVLVQDPDRWNAKFFQRWGRLLGQVHHTGKQYSVNDPSTRRLVWSPKQPFNHELFKGFTSDYLKGKYQELVERMIDFPRDEHNFGLIHNDFHQGNYFVDKEKITLFDFDDCAYFYFAYDIATAFYHAYWQHTSFNSAEVDFTVEFLTHFLNGYAKSNVLTNEMIDQLPVFLKLREFFLYVLFLKVWDGDNLEDWQVYTIHNLKSNIENNKTFADLDYNLLTKIKKNIHKPL